MITTRPRDSTIKYQLIAEALVAAVSAKRHVNPGSVTNHNG